MSTSIGFIARMSARDKARLMQRLLCARNIDDCEIEDEDEQGFCKQYQKRDDIEFIRSVEK